jgi:glycyl-tRNA synthetase
MFKTKVGPVEDEAATVYLRPETAQGIFVNFENVMRSMRRKLPFGIAQIGKSFRNEITPRHFIFRVREFEQMEIEFFIKPPEFCRPGEKTDEDWHREWIEERRNWYLRYGISAENLRVRAQAGDELAHYAKACSDIEYLFPTGWSELEGIANRRGFDLGQHMQFSRKDLRYFDQEANAHYIPWVIEPSAGVDRSTLAFLVDAYREDEVKGDRRSWLKLHKSLAPVKAAVFPLLANRDELVAMAKGIYRQLRGSFNAAYDDSGGIGKLYRRQDEIGTPYCITVDVQSVEDGMVTVRDRDTMLQERIDASKVFEYVSEGLKRN